MFWKFEMEKMLMEQHNPQGNYLIINRVQVLGETGCSACGGGFAQGPNGDKALVVTVGEGGRTFFFCGGCGDNIMGRLASDEARKHYVWDWAVPLREGHGSGHSS